MLFYFFPVPLSSDNCFALVIKLPHDTGYWSSGGSDGKASAYNVGDSGSVPGLGRSPGEGNGNPLQVLTPKAPSPWKIPWMEKPGRLQSLGLQRVKDMTERLHFQKPVGMCAV